MNFYTFQTTFYNKIIDCFLWDKMYLLNLLNSIKMTNYKWLSTQVIEYPLSQIVGLYIEEGDGEDGKVYRFNLKSASGKNLPLNECYRSFSYEERQLLTKSIETFINSN